MYIDGVFSGGGMKGLALIGPAMPLKKGDIALKDWQERAPDQSLPL